MYMRHGIKSAVTWIYKYLGHGTNMWSCKNIINKYGFIIHDMDMNVRYDGYDNE